ncbi:MAG: sugar-binding protein, partial [Victivallaceae bacterium]|nr:sugar-binding protein [Victivallaceae bacterium]
WTIRGGVERGISRDEAVRRLVKFHRLRQMGRDWPEPIRHVVVPRMKHPPRADGVIAPGEWDEALSFSGEYPISGTRLDPRRSRTLWYLGVHDETLYVAMSCEDKDVRAFSKRMFESTESVYLGDALEIFLRPDVDQPYYSEILVNPDALVWEVSHKATPSGQWDVLDSKPETKLRAGGKRTAGGYHIEIAIPLRDLKRSGPFRRFSFQLIRTDRNGKDEYRAGVPTPLLYDGHNLYGYVRAEFAGR